MKKLDATKYKFKKFERSSVFDFVKRKDAPYAVRDVLFDEKTLEKTEYSLNGAQFGFYGTGGVHEHAAVELSDGSLLFCIVYGSRFVDTFSSAENISMQYFSATLI